MSSDSTDESNYDSEEEDTMGDMISFEEQQKINAIGSRRRNSVSAESSSAMQAQMQLMAKAVSKIPKTDTQVKEIETAIGSNLLFQGLSAEQKTQVYEAMFEKTVGPGESSKIIKQGDEGDNFYVLESGSCDVIVNEKKVAELAAGATFGELALMYFAPRAATIQATSECHLWCMDRMTFRSFLLSSGKEKRDQQKDFLKTVELLKPLEEEERQKICDVLQVVSFSDGGEIMVQGDEGDAIYFLESGGAVAIKDSSEVFTYDTPGQYFGELALMTNKPRAATVAAKGECTCLRLDRQSFERLVGRCEDVLQRQALKYLAMAPKVEMAPGSAAAAGATFDMDDAPELAAAPAPSAAVESGGNATVTALQAENANLKRRNAELEARVADLERKLASGGSAGIASLPSSSSIAQKVEESRRARQRLAALLNLDENGN